MTITYKNSTKEISISQAIKLSKSGIVVIVNDGTDITFLVEKKKPLTARQLNRSKNKIPQ